MLLGKKVLISISENASRYKIYIIKLINYFGGYAPFNVHVSKGFIKRLVL